MLQISLSILKRGVFCVGLGLASVVSLQAGDASVNPEAGERHPVLLSSAPWQFFGIGDEDALPPVGSSAFDQAKWQTVQVPHVFQTRAHFNDLQQGYYRRDITVTPDMAGKRLYLIFEGAASIADVYVNGKHLGQHRGAYTRFIFDATEALHPGDDNHLVVAVNNRFKDKSGNEVPVENADGTLAASPPGADSAPDDGGKTAADCLPNGSGLYKVWGGLYRKVWLMAVDPLHVDPTDYASPGVYITPSNISSSSADLAVQVLLRNAGAAAGNAVVRATVLDPKGGEVATLTERASCPPGARTTVDLKGRVLQPKLWAPSSPNLYHVRVTVERDGQVVDAVTQPLGFRQWVFNPEGAVTLNGQPIFLGGSNLHQETEAKASALDDDDFIANYKLMQDLGFNFIRLPHYPHAQLEYDLCDSLGIVCWAENGHSNKGDKIGPTADRITTEMVKQNYNHPSIAFWSVGNEAGRAVAEELVPVVKALDPARPVAVANMGCSNADIHGQNTYPGWYQGRKLPDIWKFKAKGYVTETGGGGVTTTHCDYAGAHFSLNKYEPEEYQQLVAEGRFQKGVKDNPGTLGMLAWWTMRDFNDHKYKGPIGWNTKGLLTYAGDKKDAYYLYRCFLRPNEPTLHITSKRYFLRQGAVDNGIKVYSSARTVTLKLNGQTVSSLQNGQYSQEGNRRVDNVFYWPVPLRTGKNDVVVSDDAGHSDSATIYFYGAGGQPEAAPQHPLVENLQSSNPVNAAYFMDMPVQAQWPIYYDLDSTADNSFDELPEALRDARWIATRRVTKDGEATDLSFKVMRPATVFVACTQTGAEPAYLAGARFQKAEAPGFVWRDNRLQLVPALLYSHHAAAGETIRIAQPDRDQIVLVKEDAP